MLRLRINGEEREIDGVDPSTPLLWVLRDHLQLTGTKYGCGRGLCGTCTVHLDGNPARACILPVSAADSAELTTIEGVEGSVAEAVKQAWRDNSVPQCGFCQAGQVMSACSLLTSNASPSDEDVDSAMSGNLCRCATYDRIRAAIGQASEALNGEAK
jgi:isoquinoline 1-oxidoreductase alpha subunit